MEFIYTYVRCVHLNCLYLLPIGQFALIHAPIQTIDTHTLTKTIGNCESEDDVFVTTTDSNCNDLSKYDTV